NARNEDLENMRIIIMIADLEGASSDFVQNTLASLILNFKDHFSTGLLEVIVPPAAWYPDLKAVPSTLHDPADRMYWRTKQNLDYAYLMIYAARMGDLYLQLEDDIEAAVDYTGDIFKSAARSDWFILELSTLGYIGKLMRSRDVLPLAVYILLNYQFKPVDWLLDDYCTNRYCGHGMEWKACVKEIDKHRVKLGAGLFQHVGYYSSFKGNTNKLKDK
ncbi:hypothetical protein PENTCL1PPCAC_8589, partial [Pristionchus entomophagus]